MLYSFILVWLTLLKFAITAHPYVLHEERRHHSLEWTRSSNFEVSATTPLVMQIALKQKNLHHAASHLYQLVDPTSPLYGQHWTADKVREIFAPDNETITLVRTWLEVHGVDSHKIKSSQSGGWLYVETTVGKIEHLLNTSYHLYIHPESHELYLGCEHYFLPDNVRHHIDFITPTSHSFTKFQPRLAQRDGKKNFIQESGCFWLNDHLSPEQNNIMGNITLCDKVITPACLRALYRIPAPTATAPNNSYAIVEYGAERYLQSDLDLFFSKYFKPLVGRPPQFAPIDGALPTENVSTIQNISYEESDLDLQYAMALAYPLNVTVYQTGSIEHRGDNNNFLDAIDGEYCSNGGGDDLIFDPTFDSPDCGVYEPPKVISISYGKDEYYRSAAYSERQCLEFLKLGLRGSTVLFPSGDNGVAGNHGCLDPIVNSTTFSPMFPATCPFVTAVGATQIVPNSTVFSPERAADGRMRSGGGFSNYFQMPNYQKQHILDWFGRHPTGYGNMVFNDSQASRGYPDVAVNGVNYLVAEEGNFRLVSGTSASAPVFGAMISLINDARLRAGKSSVGFLNPILYSNPQVFNDITAGNNPGCGLPGFNATIGWDPITGLGTPDFPKLMDLFMSLP